MIHCWISNYNTLVWTIKYTQLPITHNTHLQSFSVVTILFFCSHFLRILSYDIIYSYSHFTVQSQYLPNSPQLPSHINSNTITKPISTLCKHITKIMGNNAQNTIPVAVPFHHLIIIIHFSFARLSFI